MILDLYNLFWLKNIILSAENLLSLDVEHTKNIANVNIANVFSYLLQSNEIFWIGMILVAICLFNL